LPTPTPKNTSIPVRTATNTPQSGGGGGDDDGCNMTPGASAGGPMLWLLIPAALVAWRRQARK
jgi:MYXO-CTERM domain-containing protein